MTGLSKQMARHMMALHRVLPSSARSHSAAVAPKKIANWMAMLAARRSLHDVPYAKELRLLQHVLDTAEPGKPASACEAIESFGNDVLGPSNSWLKIAGDQKSDVLTSSVSRAPAGSILEIGAYCGYSAIQMAMACPGRHICSLEVDPMHVVIARNVIAFAGLSHMIDVWTGHSKDLIPRLAARYNAPGKEMSKRFAAVFMDQRGSRYNEDLTELERYSLLLPGAVVVADNVLKPGAPLFLWRVCVGGGYETEVVRVKEFAMPSEDWMSVSVLRRQLTPAEDPAVLHGVSAKPSQEDEAEDFSSREKDEPPWGRPPALLLRLDAEADRMRERATRPGRSVTFAEWSAFAVKMRDRLAEAGIEPTMDALQFVRASSHDRPPSCTTVQEEDLRDHQDESAKR